MPLELAVFIFFIVTFPFLLAIDHFRTRRKLRIRLEKAFGKAPSGSYRLTGLDSYWRTFARHKAHWPVDDITWADLDMDEIFDRIDACQSSLGSGWLYAALRTPLSPDQLQQREQLLALWEEQPALRLNIQMLLAQLGKRPGADLPHLLAQPQAYQLSTPWKYPLCAALPWVCLLALPFAPQTAGSLLLASLILNGVLYLQAQKQLDTRLATFGYLLRAVSCGKKTASALQKVRPDLTRQLRQTAAAGKKLGGGPLLAGAASSDAFSQLLGVLTLLPVIQYCRSVGRLESLRPQLLELFDLLGELDGSIALCSFRRSLPLWCRPTFWEEPGLDAQGLGHPLLDDPVRSDARVDGCWLLTGSNASGKSTFLRAVAINCILAQTIHTCTASRFSLAPGAVASSMAVRDDVTGGESYFVAEIRSLGRLVKMAGTLPLYCFIDEILKGTNTAERIAASQAVLGYLARKGALCMAATHDLELVELAGSAYQNHHFCETITENGVEFDYKLKDGPCRTRNALRLLEYYHFPDEILQSAWQMAKDASSPPPSSPC